MFNSDYEIRLATLAALGGDTSTTFDSVYSIDLEILRLSQGGGGGLDYDQIKTLLASSGVTEIVFHDSGDTTSVTLDYELLSQIGQGGGGDYVCVNSVAALSGITSPKDGMLAYVSEKGLWKYYTMDNINKWLAYDVYIEKVTTGASSELDTICEDLATYGVPFTARIKYNDEWGSIYWALQPTPVYNGNWICLSGNIHQCPNDAIRMMRVIISKDQYWALNEGQYFDLARQS